MAENAGLENHRIKSFKNKGRDVEVRHHVKAMLNSVSVISLNGKGQSYQASLGSLAPAAAA